MNGTSVISALVACLSISHTNFVTLPISLAPKSTGARVRGVDEIGKGRPLNRLGLADGLRCRLRLISRSGCAAANYGRSLSNWVIRAVSGDMGLVRSYHADLTRISVAAK